MDRTTRITEYPDHLASLAAILDGRRIEYSVLQRQLNGLEMQYLVEADRAARKNLLWQAIHIWNRMESIALECRHRFACAVGDERPLWLSDAARDHDVSSLIDC